MFAGCNINRFDFPDSPALIEDDLALLVPNTAETSMGQENEVSVFENKYQEVSDRIGRRRGAKKNVAGVSRGAICAVNGNYNGADAFFLESPASRLQDIVGGFCKKFGAGWVPFLSTGINWLILPCIFGRYNARGPHPIDNTQNIPNDTPIFISYTEKDNLIPPSSTVKLAEKFLRTGHNNVYLYGAESGRHGGIIHDGWHRQYHKVGRAFVRRVTEQASASQEDREGDAMLDAARVRPNNINDVIRVRRQLERAESYSGRNLLSFLAVATIAGLIAKKLAGT